MAPVIEKNDDGDVDVTPVAGSSANEQLAAELRKVWGSPSAPAGPTGRRSLGWHPGEAPSDELPTDTKELISMLEAAKARRDVLAIGSDAWIEHDIQAALIRKQYDIVQQNLNPREGPDCTECSKKKVLSDERVVSLLPAFEEAFDQYEEVRKDREARGLTSELAAKMRRDVLVAKAMAGPEEMIPIANEITAMEAIERNPSLTAPANREIQVAWEKIAAPLDALITAAELNLMEQLINATIDEHDLFDRHGVEHHPTRITELIKGLQRDVARAREQLVLFKQKYRLWSPPWFAART